ncbi:unnamed protein product [Owenia fusiformis]|uniref:Uncharacterized protein n=1 Tax=Owenia fusiformis TaxID=6347 RepID=A0A8J1TFG8_OWEFU|nr:unnamed protein product [Owenia fusiformis]
MYGVGVLGEMLGLWMAVFISMAQGFNTTDRARNITHLLDTLLSNYDGRLRPNQGANEPMVVKIDLNIRSMGPISDTDMAYQMDCYFRQTWTDSRLKFHGGDIHRLIVSIKMMEQLWKPDTVFYNGKRSYLHTVTSPNKFLRIEEDGTMYYSMRLTIKATCPMHLEKFPMDMQSCPLRVGSFAYTQEEVTYVWKNGNSSVKVSPDVQMSQFNLKSIPSGNETLFISSKGYFSVLWCTFDLERHMGYFLINVYFPCGLLVIISWVSFWINREATSDRIALGVTTILTMAFLGIDNKKDLPKVSYSTALDWFVAICFAFVLATIVEFSGVHYFTKHGSGEHDDINLEYEEGEDEEDFDGVGILTIQGT